MATPHINAEMGAFADVVLMPGDPLRAKYIAETFLDDVVQVCDVRNMYGYTGSYKGRKVSVMGHGMGIPSCSIYATELIKDFGVKKIIRVGSCGAVSEDIKVKDWTDEQFQAIRSLINEDYTVEGELRSETQLNIKRLMDIGCYRGIRHRIGLPLRGQGTKNNARTRKGRKKTVANKKKATK